MTSSHIAGRLSILHVVAPAPFGGLESVLRSLAGGHTRRGHDVRVAAVTSPGRETHPFTAALESDGVAVTALRIGDRDYAGERRAIRELCRIYRPDVVHTHGYRPDAVDGSVARAEGIAAVSTCHGFIESTVRGRVSQWIQRRALRRFDAIVAVSSPIQVKLRASGVPADRIHLVPNGFSPTRDAVARDEARRELRLPAGRLIGWVGRLSEEKGPDLALDAFAALRDDATLVMIGAGRDAETLRARAAALGVGERVVWSGAVANAGRFFSAFDVFLLSSRTEGTPMALLEAMAARVPIVATAVGGVPDVIDASCARVVAPGDVAAMREALAEVLSQADQARHRAERAMTRLEERFAIEPWLSRYEAIYASVRHK